MYHWMIDKTCSVIDNVLSCYGSSGFNWYEMKIESILRFWGLKEI